MVNLGRRLIRLRQKELESEKRKKKKREECKSIWPAPVVSVTRVCGVAIMEGLKKCENRDIHIYGHNHDYRGIPIGLHISKTLKKPGVKDFLKKHSKFATQLFGSGTYVGMDANAFYAATNQFHGKIVGFIMCDNVPDPDVVYTHAHYPDRRKYVWYIHQVYSFRTLIAGFQGGQSWKYFEDRRLLDAYLRQFPVKFA